jgi:ribonuclease T2
LIFSGCHGPAPSSVSHPSVPRSRSQAAPSQGAPANFDYYLLNLSWSPEFCYSHPSAAECARHEAFVLHGLWPENSNGTYPQDCSDAPGPANPAEYSDIYPDPGLLEHEWKTHGTCSGLSPDAFFTAARTAFESVKVPPQLAQLNAQISLPPEQILSLVTQSNPSIPAESLVLSCGNNYLTAVEVCLDKQLHPTACGQVRSCRARTVRIPPP